MTDNFYLWMDFQLSSNEELNSGKKVTILEMATVLTDSKMNVLSHFSTPIMEKGNHPGTTRLETDPALRKGYDEAGLWEAMLDGMGIAAADIFLRDSLAVAIEDSKIPEDTLFTVVCRRAHLTAQLIKRDMPNLINRISRDFIDVDAIKTFFETFMSHSMTDDEFNYLFRANPYNAEINVQQNIEAISLILTKLPDSATPVLISKKGRRSL